MASENRPPSLADKGVFYVLSVNVVVGIFALLVFSLIRWYNQRKNVYEVVSGETPPRKARYFDEENQGEMTKLLPSKTQAAPPEPESFFGWFLPLILMGSEEHLRRIGYDAMLYFYFQRSVMVFLILIGLFSCIILIPVNMSGNKNLQGFLATTITNLDNQSHLYWFHALATLGYSLLLYGWVWHMRNYLLRCYGHYFTDYAHREVKSAVSSHTIWIKNFPRDCLNVQVIKEHFESLLRFHYQFRRLLTNSKVEKHVEANLADENTWLEEEGGVLKMDALGSSRTTPIIPRLQLPRIQELKGKEADIRQSDGGTSGNVENKSGDEESTSPRQPMSPSLTNSRTLATSRRLRRRPTMGFGYGGSMTQLTGEGTAPDQIEEQNAAIMNDDFVSASPGPAFMEDIDLQQTEANDEKSKRKRRLRRKLLYKEISGGVVSVNIASDIARLIAANEGYSDACGKLAFYKQQRDTLHYRPRIEFPPDASYFDTLYRLVTKADMVDAIVEYKRIKKAKYMHLQRVRRDVYTDPSAGVLFVTFTSNALAKEVVNTYSSYSRWWKRLNSETLTNQSALLKDRQWVVSQAPEPEDVIWKNLAISRMDKWLRITIVNLILLSFLTFFTTPLGIVSTLQNLLPLNGDAGSLLGAAGVLLFTYLPSLILLFFTFLLPLLIWLSSLLEGHHTISSTHKWLVVKTYLYFLFNILILPSLFLTSIDALIAKAWLNLDQLWTVLDVERFLPFSSAFLICYLLQMAVLGCSVEILRIIERVQKMFMKWKAVTTAEKRRADKFAFPHEYGMEYAYMVVIFSTTFAYSALVPLFVPAGLFYFFCKHVTDSYHLVHVRPVDFHSDGSMLWVVLEVILGTSALCQFGVATFFFLHGSKAQFSVVAILPAALVLAVLYFKATGQSFFRYPKRPKEVVIADESGTWIQDFRLAYVHDLLRDDEEHMQLLHLQALENEALEKKREAMLAKQEQEDRLLHSPRYQKKDPYSFST